MGTPVYTTREVVKSALENRGGSSTDAQIDRLIATSSRNIERRLHRRFWPWHGTRMFAWPSRFQLESWVLDLGPNELVSLEELTAAGTAIPTAQALLEPADAGPPYTRIELDRGTDAAFASGPTAQRSVAVTGVFGYDLNEEQAGVTVGVTLAGAGTLEVTDSSGIGTGSLLRVGTERMIVTRMGYVSTGRTLAGALTDRPNGNVLVLDSATNAPNPGELIVVDGERMEVIDRIGTGVFVRRAIDGTAIDAHEVGATVYVRRSLTVERGACGTDAAEHAADSPVWAFVFFSPIETLCVEETIAAIMQEGAGMARTVGSEGAERETGARGLADARREADRYRRKTRNWAV